jgi:spermidine/putrescine transport system ATP-binding protein
MRGASVELKDVFKAYAHQPVVRGISLKVEQGEFFSLLGPSGCGKTTTLRLIAGFETPDGGVVLYDGERRSSPAYANDVNLVFQHYALFPHLTVERNVAFGLEMKKLAVTEIRRRVQEALELVHLDGLEGRYPKQLSGGQQQRVALARAIVTEPSILLLDEPLGALDLKLRKAMQLELKSLQRRLGLTFIYVTHDQEEALAMSDRVAVMHRGRILQVGTPSDIYERPTTRFVAEFIGDSNLLEGRVTGRGGSHAMVNVNGMTFRVVTDVTDGTVVLALRPEKISLTVEPTPEVNSVAGVVEDHLYLGTDVQYRVRVRQDLFLNVREQNLGRKPYGVGEKLYACWDANAAIPVISDVEA